MFVCTCVRVCLSTRVRLCMCVSCRNTTAAFLSRPSSVHGYEHIHTTKTHETQPPASQPQQQQRQVVVLSFKSPLLELCDGVLQTHPTYTFNHHHYTTTPPLHYHDHNHRHDPLTHPRTTNNVPCITTHTHTGTNESLRVSCRRLHVVFQQKSTSINVNGVCVLCCVVCVCV